MSDCDAATIHSTTLHPRCSSSKNQLFVILMAISIYLATVVTGAWVVHTLFPKETKKYWSNFQSFLYQRVYLPHRSEISLWLAWIFQFDSFICDCCCLELGEQDLDTAYKDSCQCDQNNLKHCTLCISTYVETQVTDNHCSRPVCMLSRKCVLDDRLVRKRLSKTVVPLLDRMQVMESDCPTNEKLWLCPAADCLFAGFIPKDAMNRTPSRFSFRNLFWRSKKQDSRCIQCPTCAISSCQFCRNLWSKGTANHNYATCDAYQRQLEKLELDDARALNKWKKSAATQVCRSETCNNVIEKDGGCIHMTCRCGYQFCWVCGEQWSPQHSYFCRERRFITWFGSWFQ